MRHSVLPAGTALHQGRYVVEKVLGEGGMGAVYLARQARIGGKRVAIKEMLVDLHDAEARKRAVELFQRESSILQRLDHLGLVKVHASFEDNGAEYLVMDFVDGETLDHIFHKHKKFLPVSKVVGWMDQLCEVLQYLHSHNPPIIFRDLKPANIMLDIAGRIRLIDFGIARIFDPDSKTTTFIKGAGTHGFAPVEQYGGGSTDTRSDVYALGATMYVLLTRTLPPASVSRMTGEEQLWHTYQFNPNVPKALDACILKMMQIRKEDRYQSIVEVRHALDEAWLASSAATMTSRFCSLCGTDLEPDASECPKCGSVSEDAAAPKPPTPPKVPPAPAGVPYQAGETRPALADEVPRAASAVEEPPARRSGEYRAPVPFEPPSRRSGEHRVEHMPEPPSRRSGEHRPDSPSRQSGEHRPDPPSRRSGEHAVERPPDPPSRRSGEHAVERPPDPPSRRSGEHAVERAPDPPSRRSGEHMVEAVQRSGEHALERKARRNADTLTEWPEELRRGIQQGAPVEHKPDPPSRRSGENSGIRRSGEFAAPRRSGEFETPRRADGAAFPRLLDPPAQPAPVPVRSEKSSLPLAAIMAGVALLVLGLMAWLLWPHSPPAAAGAKLEIQSQPAGAKVLVDGKDVGPAPVSVPVGAGEHEVVLSKDGFVTETEHPRVNGTESVPVVVRMQAATAETSLVLKVTPDAVDVTLDGHLLAGHVGPGSQFPITPGQHTLIITRKGYAPFEEMVTAEAGQPLVVQTALAATSGVLDVDSTPPGAHVFVDDEDRGVTPLVLEGFKAGSISVRIQLAGYKDWKQMTSVEIGKTTSIKAPLQTQ
ncbi:MAG: protein kinase domain-containing protein [Candidatus Xenobia bacterium]